MQHYLFYKEIFWVYKHKVVLKSQILRLLLNLGVMKLQRKKSTSNAIFLKLCIQIDIGILSHIKVKKLEITSPESEIWHEIN